MNVQQRSANSTLALTNAALPRQEKEIAQLRNESLIIVPGLNNSDQNHWQTLWENSLDTARISVAAWHKPDLDKWRYAIKRSLSAQARPSYLIAHSFGALAATTVAVEHPEKIAGLFLVAPADPDKFQLSQKLPQSALSVPTHMVASSNDPWLTQSKASRWAARWGASYCVANGKAHINSDSGIGFWAEGLQELAQFISQSKGQQRFTKTPAKKAEAANLVAA